MSTSCAGVLLNKKPNDVYNVMQRKVGLSIKHLNVASSWKHFFEYENLDLSDENKDCQKPDSCQLMEVGCKQKYTGDQLQIEDVPPFRVTLTNADTNWIKKICVQCELDG